MSRKNLRIDQLTHRLGYNTRDNPEQISNDACQMMVNVLPGDPASVVRDGVRKFTSFTAIDDITTGFPWDDGTDSKFIYLSGDDLYWVARDGEHQLLKAGAFSTHEVRFVRVKNYGLLISNFPGQAYRIWWDADAGAFGIAAANIQNSLYGVHQVQNTAPGNGNVPAFKVRAYLITLICRDDDDGLDGSGDPILVTHDNGGTFHPGVCESTFFETLTFAPTVDAPGQSPGLFWFPGAAIDPQVTHIRVHVSQQTDSAEKAEGYEKHWLADIPAKGPNAATFDLSTPYYIDTSSVEDIVASLNFWKMSGYSPIPPATFGRYYQGRLWVGGAGTKEEIGRFFYSEDPIDLVAPMKWATVFRPGEYFKDCSYVDTDDAVGMGVSANDLIFFLKESVWYLRDGDPSYEPIFIDSSKGTRFPESITQINDDLGYLSNQGPAMVHGRQIDIIVAFAASEVWPELHDGSTGLFFTYEGQQVIRGAFLNENWVLSNGSTMVAFYMPSRGHALGAWRIEFAYAGIGFILTQVTSKLVLLHGATPTLDSTTEDARTVWELMAPGVKNDNGADIWAKGRYKARLLDPERPDQHGEVKILKMLMRFADASPPFYTITSDYTRKQIEFQYNQEDSFELLPPERNEKHRDIIEQVVPEGLIGKVFEIEYRKIHKSPYQFSNRGWILEVMPISYPSEWISSDLGDNLVEVHPDVFLHLKFDEDRAEAKDFSVYGHHHFFFGGIGGRVWEELAVPGGGQALTASEYSGYLPPDLWKAMDYIGDGVGGLNSKPFHNWRGVFMPVVIGSGVIIHQGGDGVNYWRLQINTDGSVEFRLKTSTLSRSYKSPAATIVAGVWFFLIFQLSNYGQSGSFYGGPRTSNFSVIATSQEDF